MIVDTFTRFARAIPIPDERADTVAKLILDEWISIFGPMERLLSDRGPNFIGTVVKAMAEQLGVNRVKTSPLHPQANGCVERWNRTLMQDIACFMSTGSEDWDAHVALACFRYNTVVNEATGLTPYEAMFGISAYMSWGAGESSRVRGEPYELSSHLRDLHDRLLSRGVRARELAADEYDKDVKDLGFVVGDRVLVWSPELASREGNKIIRPWLGPYRVDEVLSPVSFMLKSELGGKIARVHPNRMQKISAAAVQTCNAKNGVFPDGLRLLERMKDSKEIVDPRTGKRHRLFKLRIAGRKSPKWTKEEDIPAVIVRLFDRSLADLRPIPEE